MRLALLVLAVTAANAAAAPSPAAPAVESARYAVSGTAPWRVVRPVEGPGYRVALSSPDGRELVATVVVDGTPLRRDAPFPPALASLPDEARALVTSPRPADPDADALARLLLRGARTELEAVERVIGWVAHRIRYDPPGPRPESAAECLASRRGSCVGRSLLAADLLIRAGVPARQVTGILVARDAAELTPDTRELFNEGISGVRHRWIEVYVPGLGWVPSDPGGLANTVTSRHLELAGPPEAGFGVTILSRTPELKRVRAGSGGLGAPLARPRAGSAASAATEATDLPRPEGSR